jgi:hypothetical protein
MTAPITVTIPQQLGCIEAHRRIETGFAKLVNLLPGKTGACSKRWDDQLTFSAAALGQTVSGVVTVHDTVVTMEIELPGVLGVLANKLKDRLRTTGQLLLTKK